MTQRPLLSACALLLTMSVSCGGTGEVLNLHVGAGQPALERTLESPVALKVAIKPFEDGRTESSRLGTRIDLWGGDQEFQLGDGEPGDVTAMVMRDVLRNMGWQAELVTPDQPAPDADVLVTGTIEELAVDAEGKLFRTEIEVRSKISVKAFNRSDTSTVQSTLSGAGSEELFWFEPQDAQKLLSETLTDSFRKFVASTKVEGRLLRLK